MSVLNMANLKKTLYYLKRNGFGKTVSAMRERLERRGQPLYRWKPLSEEEKERQRLRAAEGFSDICFSIVAPLYHTPEKYLQDMITSVMNQTYPKWELILADATESGGTEKISDFTEERGKSADISGQAGKDTDGNRIRAVAESYGDSRIRYYHLAGNGGIAENTNQGIALAEGGYVGLLDHDDLLTDNALYEMAARIGRERQRGIEPQILYSDEDKCNGDGTDFYDPHFKEKFNLDLFLSNNYICHFMVIKRELIQKLLLRKEYDGAQDYDLALRGVDEILTKGQEKEIVHIPQVLYHWRCHTGSTADNPQSKLYAYEAGRRAVQDFADRRGWKANASDTEHLGFYRLEYEGNIFRMRPDLAAVGGPVVYRGKVVGGRMSLKGKVFYEGLPVSYSGYLHRAALQQDAEALDIRNMEVREELRELFKEITGVTYRALPGTEIFDTDALPKGTDCQQMSVSLGEAFGQKGYRLLYLPDHVKILKNPRRREHE
ncbi:MAG: glycosyltransferase [Blautia sp.]|nr:glycosyltransferase [Blautia sp.]